MKLAWLSPFGSPGSGIAAYSAAVLKELCRLGQVTIFASDLPGPGQPALTDLPIVPMGGCMVEDLLPQLSKFDAVIYHLGNHLAYHHTIFALAWRHPGIVILHDPILQDFFRGLYLEERRDPAGYLAEMIFSHGELGRQAAEAILAGRADKWLTGAELARIGMARSAVRGSLGVVVHSEYAAHTLEGAAAPVQKVLFPAPVAAERWLAQAEPAQARGEDARLVLLTYGYIYPNKLVEEVIEAIGENAFLRQTVRYFVIGAIDPQYSQRLRAAVQAQRLQHVVHFLGHQPDEVLFAHLQAADIVVNLRYPHRGESSISLLEAAFAGKAVLIWRDGPYAEYPADTVAAVTDVAAIGLALEALARDSEGRRHLGKRLQRFARTTFTTGRYCRELLAFIEACYRRRTAFDLADMAAPAIAAAARKVPPGAANWNAVRSAAIERLAALIDRLSEPPDAAVQDW